MHSSTLLSKERDRNEFYHIQSLVDTSLFFLAKGFNGGLIETLFHLAALKVRVKSEPNRQPSPGERKNN